MYTWWALNSQRSSHFGLLSAGIKGKNHFARQFWQFYFLNTTKYIDFFLHLSPSHLTDISNLDSWNYSAIPFLVPGLFPKGHPSFSVQQSPLNATRIVFLL